VQGIFGMPRWVFGAVLIFAGMVEPFAGELVPPGDTAPAPANRHCAGYGRGFFAVRGSDNCIKITGYISAGATFVTGPGYPAVGGSFNLPPPSSGIDSGAGVSGDMRFETPLGPGQVSIAIRHGPYPQSHFADQ
jgi:Porin subfamily